MKAAYFCTMAGIRSYLSLVKFSHTIFAMPFALIGFVLAWTYLDQMAASTIPGWHAPVYSPWQSEWIRSSNIPYDAQSLIIRFILVVACMVFARSAAMAFNRYLDRSFDARNPRTAIREIPRGILRANTVLVFVVVNCLLFVIATYFINRTCFYLSPVALIVILGYSYTKRFTALCHLVLGLGLSLAPIGAYLAVLGEFAVLPVLFSIAVIFWVSGFDIIYALQDEEFDKAQKLYSIPAWLGKSRSLLVSKILHLLSASSVIVAGILGDFGPLYWTGVAVFIGMLVYQHSLVRPNDLRKVNLAFMTANGIASIVFAAFVICDLIINKP